MLGRLQQDSMEQVDNDEEAEDENDEKYLLGIVEVNVVGLQYYHGRVTDEEMVGLIREPDNAYDKNAVRVVNILGQQIGHIERGKACHLAPLVDGELAVIEGIVPRGSKNKFRMPCLVHIFCKPEHEKTALMRLRRAGIVLSSGGRGDESMPSQGSAKTAGKSKKQKQSLDDVFSMLAQGSGQRQTMDPSPIISSCMFSHQKEALAWMVQRENSSKLPPFWEMQRARGNKSVLYKNTITNFSTETRPSPLRGGVLADDMGLGKTLALLALIATNRPGAILPPLVNVCQVPAEPTGSRPSKRRKVDAKAEALKDTVDSSFPPQPNGPRATLIVCPLSVLSNWSTQLEEHTAPDSLGVHLYHGSDRIKDPKLLRDFDIVLTTYNILATEGCGEASPLQKVQWLRVILDEAHLVKSPKAQQTKAVVALKSERRWAVTGTPIQNSARDLFSFMQFLRLEPLDESSFWIRTVERPLMSGDPSGLARLQALMVAIALRRTKDMQIDGHRLVELPRKTVTMHTVNCLPRIVRCTTKLRKMARK